MCGFGVKYPLMIAQCENEYIAPFILSMARVQFPAVVECFKGISLADHMRCLIHRSDKTKG